MEEHFHNSTLTLESKSLSVTKPLTFSASRVLKKKDRITRHQRFHNFVRLLTPPFFLRLDKCRTVRGESENETRVQTECPYKVSLTQHTVTPTLRPSFSS